MRAGVHDPCWPVAMVCILRPMAGGGRAEDWGVLSCMGEGLGPDWMQLEIGRARSTEMEEPER